MLSNVADIFQVINGCYNGVEGENAVTCGFGKKIKDGWYYLPKNFDDGVGPLISREEAIESFRSHYFDELGLEILINSKYTTVTVDFDSDDNIKPNGYTVWRDKEYNCSYIIEPMHKNLDKDGVICTLAFYLHGFETSKT